MEAGDDPVLGWKRGRGRAGKSEKPHEIVFEERVITELTLEKLKKADDPSPFPALTQIEVYGREAEKL